MKQFGLCQGGRLICILATLSAASAAQTTAPPRPLCYREATASSTPLCYHEVVIEQVAAGYRSASIQDDIRKHAKLLFGGSPDERGVAVDFFRDLREQSVMSMLLEDYP